MVKYMLGIEKKGSR